MAKRKVSSKSPAKPRKHVVGAVVNRRVALKKKKAQRIVAKKASAPKAPPVHITVNLEGKKPMATKAQKAARRAARLQARKVRAETRAFNRERPAWATGSEGGRAYHASGRQPKPRTGPQYTTIVISDPKRGARPVAIGKRGGVYAQKKWDSTKSVLAALPAAAAITTAAAFVGLKLKEQPQIAEWATWYPGGYTGMALTVGAAGAYVAYKNRHVLGLLVGLGIGFYALVKLALAKLSGQSLNPDAETSALPEETTLAPESVATPAKPASSAPPVSSTPGAPATGTSPSEPLGRAIALTKAGNLDYSNGNFGSAANNYFAAFTSYPDPLIKFNNGRALHKLAQQQRANQPDTKATNGMFLWAANALAALRAYDTFISMEGKTSKMTDLDNIKELKGFAKTFRKEIFDELIKAGQIEEDTSSTAAVEGDDNMDGNLVAGADDDYEVMIEGDDDDDEVEGDEIGSHDEEVIEIEGDDDDDEVEGDDDEEIEGDEEYEVVEGHEDGYAD